ncbi:VC0807 family protein [Reinekea marina]|uniref:VC0807 family protein n=1 Tax=Reinekea marina TaxID=1310421 RepID=A0ABV7WN38_9GAMM|nr:VC0807 family protein [Reinekea marina]MDN3648593.1 VC0807 family protein [Reinekea marina]
MDHSDNSPAQEAAKPAKAKQGGFLSNLMFNIVLPVLIMSKLSGDDMLGPLYSIAVALAFPVGYGIWEMRLTKKVNGFSVLGVVSVLLTGGISLLQLDPKYIAIKEAAIPGFIGLAVIISQKSHKSVVKLILFNDQIFRLDRVHSSLAEHNNEKVFEQKMTTVTYLVAASFFVSSALNYILAKIVLKSAPGTTEFAEELGRMTALSYPVIVIPSMVVLGFAMWYLFTQLKKLTHLPLDDLMVDQSKK